MWREELGLVEMLLTYIGDFVQFESYSGWRPVLIDILSSHEEVRRRRLAEAVEYSSGERMKDNIGEDFFDETRQFCNQNEDHSVRGSTGGRSNMYSQSIMEYSHGMNREDDNRFIESTRMPPRISEYVDDTIDIEDDVMVGEETTEHKSESQISEESIICLEMETRGVVSEFGNTLGAPEISNAMLERNEWETDNPVTFNCHICGKSFVSKRKFTSHVKYHNGVRSFKCDKCDMSFSQKSDLKRHQRNHSGERPFPCHVCGKAFSQSTHLKTHIRGVHLDERPFSCKMCEKAFLSLCVLKRHMRTRHDSQVTEVS